MKPSRTKTAGPLSASSAFTLVELLTVVAIMAIIMGLLAASLSQGQGRGVQTAAAQVASGMGLARQTAITRNTDALFIIAPAAGAAPTDFYPEEPFRYWAVVYSNRGQNTWSLAVDWTELSPGTVFMSLFGEGYDTVNWSTNGTMPSAPESFAPKVQPSSKGEWQYFNNYTNMTVVWDGGSATLSAVPFIGFKSTGKGFALQLAGNKGYTPSNMAVAVGEGSVVDGGRLALRSVNNITQVETDSLGGRVVVRPRDSYR
jgi:prepilin-type N-terminal cleavage/methylation domain-containing protein